MYMTTHTFQSTSRDYISWSIDPPLESMIDPIQNKLFSNDVFQYENNKIKILKSHVRNYEYHCGVLILHGNKSYGKTKKNKLYYKCIPNDRNLPIFLIPYELRIGFTKDHVNKYVLFRFSNWDGKHPIGILSETFGNVDNFSSFCSYQLWCNNLVYSIAKFTRESKLFFKNSDEEEWIKNITNNTKYCFHNNTNDYVFSIDPNGSKDLDDAFSVCLLEDLKYKITIYIANVATVLDNMNMWENLSKRVSTIYLPENRRTLLPEILSDQYCSLLKNTVKPAFAMDIVYDSSKNAIIGDPYFYNTIVHVSQNFVYDEEDLLNNYYYKLLLEITTNLELSIKDSHDVVTFWMVKMNTFSAEKLYYANSGVFRNVKKQVSCENTTMKKTMDLWNNFSGSYELFSSSNIYHETLKVKYYAHITSPIRRLVDIANQCYFLQIL